MDNGFGLPSLRHLPRLVPSPELNAPGQMGTRTILGDLRFVLSQMAQALLKGHTTYFH